ncbi:tyrosine-type recombinase/integrase [Gordonia malaquae]|uniref:tyrosine-type recombinase/integrase n=1 Tax=Gordonia malaquae TaxID=410332 RepID=UPI003BF90F8A
MTRRIVENDADPKRRPLTDDEVNRLFEASSDLVQEAISRRRNGAITAYRDSVILKVAYGWGLRANEIANLGTADWMKNPRAQEFGKYGAVRVRYGKGRGGYKPRTVMSTMAWPGKAVDVYLHEVRPRFPNRSSGALFLTERGTQISAPSVTSAFSKSREHAGLPNELTLHCLRHTYASKLAENGFDHSFIQDQLGHTFMSTTAIYTHLPSDMRVRAVRDYLDQALADRGPPVRRRRDSAERATRRRRLDASSRLFLSSDRGPRTDRWPSPVHTCAATRDVDANSRERTSSRRPCDTPARSRRFYRNSVDNLVQSVCRLQERKV